MQKKTTMLSKLNSKVVSEIQQILYTTGNKVEAMKVYMRETQTGLKEAKDAVDKELDFLQKDDPKLRELVRKVDAERLKWFDQEIQRFLKRK